MIELQTIKMGEDQMQITTISIDIAKNIFHFIGCNLSNKIVVKKAIKLKRSENIGQCDTEHNQQQKHKPF
ncbi:hypothetical protein CTT31_23420 [Pseudoalteromonas maricaloris]|nr:hypothetical protein CTT31_23420 [Pseudoalteromonas flavipulchra]